MIRILTIIGARPQFIKAAAISRAIRNNQRDQIEEIIVHTGQHYDVNLSKVFFDELEIPREKYNLNIGSSNHGEQTAGIMTGVEKVALKENPDAILLYGDTNSTLASCLVGIKRHIPIIHVEAGVRSYNKDFPEEVNRLICDHMSSLLFVPSDAGMNALKKEGFDLERKGGVSVSADHPLVFRCGDIMYDNTLHFLKKIKGTGKALMTKYHLPQGKHILATMHRPSNVDQTHTIKSIFKAFNTIIETHNIPIILPLHPRTSKKINQTPELKKLVDNERLFIIDPVSFLEMTVLENGAELIITDSGGVQKEAYFMKKPCLIMLDETPWPELVESKNALLVGSDYEKITHCVSYFLKDDIKLKFLLLYGDGKTSEFIIQKIIETFKSHL